MAEYVWITSIIPIADRDEMRQMVEALAEEVGAEGVTGWWSAEIGASEEAPATHCILDGYIDKKLFDLLPVGIILQPEDPAVTEE